MFIVTMDYVDESDVVKVQIRIIKYYSIKSTYTYYKILLQ